MWVLPTKFVPVFHTQSAFYNCTELIDCYTTFYFLNISQELPRLEEVINKETELYEREHGRPFLIYGQCFSDMISHQKEQHKESQKLLKSARVSMIKQGCYSQACIQSVPRHTSNYLTYLLTSLLITYLLTVLLTYSLTHSLTHLLTYSLTPWSGVFLEKLTSSHLVQKFSTSYGT